MSPRLWSEACKPVNQLLLPNGSLLIKIKHKGHGFYLCSNCWTCLIFAPIRNYQKSLPLCLFLFCFVLFFQKMKGKKEREVAQSYARSDLVWALIISSHGHVTAPSLYSLVHRHSAMPAAACFNLFMYFKNILLLYFFLYFLSLCVTWGFRGFQFSLRQPTETRNTRQVHRRLS